MVADQGLKMFSGLIVFFYLAKYLGPERFGQLNYTIAFVFIFYPIVQMGMFSILTRELINNPGKEKTYLNTAFSMCFISAIVMFLVCNGISYFFNADDGLVQQLILIYSFSLFFKPFELIDYYFQSKHMAKNSAIARSIAVLITVIVKLLLVYFKVDLTIIMYSFLLESILIFSTLSIAKIIFSKQYIGFSYTSDVIKVYFKSALPMIFSALSVAVYSRMDQIMIKKFLDNSDLGIYSSATKLYEGVTTIIFTISVSLLPALLKWKLENPKKFENLLIKFFAFLFWGSILLAVMVSIFRTPILSLLYGEEYLDAANTLTICFFSLGLSSMGALTARYFTVEKQEKKLLFRTVVTLVINLVLNIAFINLLGKEGAALATLISLFVGNYLIDYFDKDLKSLVQIKNKALLFKL